MADLLGETGYPVDLVPMETSGDRGATAESANGGLKGLFVAEIVRALQAGEIDVAVHSAKDLPSQDPPDVTIAAVPKRADPFDVVVTAGPDLPDGATVGTSSLRRAGQLRRWRPDLQIVSLRGNVETRLGKVMSGEIDAAVLAAAGLSRLAIEPDHCRVFDEDEMLPAPGQGALAVQVRTDDRFTNDIVWQIDDEDAHDTFVAERRLMHELGGGCAMPLGALARVRVPDGMARVELRIAEKEGRTWQGDVVELLPRVIDLRAVVFDPEPDPDTGESLWAEVRVTEEHPIHAGVSAAEALLEIGAGEVLQRLGLGLSP